MRLLRGKFFIMLLALALVSVNAHAAPPAATGHATGHMESCTGHQTQETSSHHCHHCDGATDVNCCCDGLGCMAAAVILPATLSGSADFTVVVLSPTRAGSLAQRILPPEPYPPRLSALT